jgi:hypothetical protein
MECCQEHTRKYSSQFMGQIKLLIFARSQEVIEGDYYFGLLRAGG